MKRRGKSPPLEAQATRHEKPYVVQDRTEEQAAGLDVFLKLKTLVKRDLGYVALVARQVII